jgi:hypothetical protein
MLSKGPSRPFTGEPGAFCIPDLLVSSAYSGHYVCATGWRNATDMPLTCTGTTP